MQPALKVPETPRDWCRDSVEAGRVQAERAVGRECFKSKSGGGEKLCVREGSIIHPEMAIITSL